MPVPFWSRHFLPGILCRLFYIAVLYCSYDAVLNWSCSNVACVDVMEWKQANIYDRAVVFPFSILIGWWLWLTNFQCWVLCLFLFVILMWGTRFCVFCGLVALSFSVLCWNFLFSNFVQSCNLYVRRCNSIKSIVLNSLRFQNSKLARINARFSSFISITVYSLVV